MINFFIAGAQKAGSSSLKHILGQHPQICTHKRHEFSYFVDEDDFKQGYKENNERYFSHYQNEKIIMGKSVTVLSDRTFVERMYNHNSDMKFVFIIRNPVDRAYSAFWYSISESWETRYSFEDAIKNNNFKSRTHKHNTDYLFMSNYKNQLDNLLAFFDKKNIKIILFEDLKKDMKSVCEDICSFLSIEKNFSPKLSIKNKTKRSRFIFIDKILNSQLRVKKIIRKNILGENFSTYIKNNLQKLNRKNFNKPKISLATKNKLIRHFTPMIEDLEKEYLFDLSAWKK